MPTRSVALRRLSAGAAAGALISTSLLLTSPAQAETVAVHTSDIRPDETTYAGWHQGYADARYASGISSQGLSSIGRSQIINGYADNDNADLAKDGVNADLGTALNGASYDVTQGQAYFQVPLFVDSDGTAGSDPAVFTTLRPAVAADGPTTIGLGDSWVSSKAFGTIAANTPTTLSTIVGALDGGASIYKTIAFGVLTDVGHTSAVSSIVFDGDTYDFAADSVSNDTVTDSEVANEETANNYASWHQGSENATGLQQVTGEGLELSGRSQVIKGYNNTSTNLTAVNANLAGVIPDASYDVESGTAFFQIALRFDNGGGVQFATLRNNGTDGALSLDQQWQSSKAINADIPANTNARLSDIVAALGNYKVIAYGVLTTPGTSAVVSHIEFGRTSTTFADAPATAITSNVVPNAIAPDESVYAGWHQGAAEGVARIANGALNLGATRSQVIKGYADNSKNTDDRNVDLAEALRTSSYDVVSGDVHFQVPLFFEDANGNTQFATLRPQSKADVGVNTFHLGDEWISSKPLGDLPANTPAQLGDILSSIGSYKVLAFGVYSDAGGNGVVRSITWNGVKSTFAKVTSTTKIVKLSNTKPSVRSHVIVYGTVTAPGGATVAGGTVKVVYRAKVVATTTVRANGTYTLHLPLLKSGTSNIRVTFYGTDQASTSTVLKSITVRK